MKRLGAFQEAGGLLFASALAIGVCCVLPPTTAQACDAEAKASDEGTVQAEAAGASAGGMRAYIDPKTREFVAPPAEALEAAEPMAGGAAEATVELRQAPSVVPGGGVVLDLRGTQRSALSGTANGEGQPVIRCDPHEAGSLPAGQ
jgi:hypothetical protein